MSGKFLYFGYGSNLLARRIHINNPSAVRVGIGKLENYQLDFNRYSRRWRGASATIARRDGRHVWGALWEINNEDLANLDKQEGVHNDIYFRHEIEVILLNGTKKHCWVYEQRHVPSITQDIQDLIEERKPSLVYWSIIVKGADESGLPAEYQKFLKTVPHNNYDGEVDIAVGLNILT